MKYSQTRLCFLLYLQALTFFGFLWNDSVDFIRVWDVQLAPLHYLIKVIAFIKSTA